MFKRGGILIRVDVIFIKDQGKVLKFKEEGDPWKKGGQDKNAAEISR